MKNLKKTFKIIMPVIAAVCTIIFTPWVLFWMWIAPLPDTVQEQVDAVIDRGLDGIIVYVDQAGKEPAFYSAGWKNRENQVPADPQSLFKIASISKLYIADDHSPASYRESYRSIGNSYLNNHTDALAQTPQGHPVPVQDTHLHSLMMWSTENRDHQSSRVCHCDVAVTS